MYGLPLNKLISLEQAQKCRWFRRHFVIVDNIPNPIEPDASAHDIYMRSVKTLPKRPNYIFGPFLKCTAQEFLENARFGQSMI